MFASMIGIEEFASRLGVHHMTIRRLIEKGDCPPYIRVGGIYRFEQHDVEKWIYDRKEIPASFVTKMRKRAGRHPLEA